MNEKVKRYRHIMLYYRKAAGNLQEDMQCKWKRYVHWTCMSKIVCTFPIGKVCRWWYTAYWPANSSQVKKVVEASNHLTTREIAFSIHSHRMPLNHFAYILFRFKARCVNFPRSDRSQPLQRISITDILLKPQEK